MFKRLFETVTGTPWTTGRDVTTEYGPTPGARYRHIVATIPDEVLLAFEPAQLHALLADIAQRNVSPAVARYAATYVTHVLAGRDVHPMAARYVASYLARSGS